MKFEEMKRKKEQAEKEFKQRTQKGRVNVLSNGDAYAEYVLGAAGDVADRPGTDLRKPRAGQVARPKSQLAGAGRRVDYSQD